MTSRTKAKKQAADAEEEQKRANMKFDWTWKEHEGVVYGDCGAKPSEKVYSFDMDGTLITPKSKGKFAKNADDWQWWNTSVVKKIKEAYDDGYKIVIMTNQGGIEKGHTKQSDIQTKIQNLTEEFGCPIQALMSPFGDYYHKPCIGMWEFFTEKMNGKVEVDLAKSAYIGDAAGRKGDFDNTDYKFAKNCGLPFKTPENFFLGQKDSLPAFEMDLSKIPENGPLFQSGKDTKVKSGKKEMIIFVGSPGSGKSSFWKNYLSDYEHINNDTLGNKKKSLKVCEEKLAAGKSVVIDNTNPGKDVRKEWLTLAKKYDYPARCFYFKINKELAFHMDEQRKKNIHRKHQSKRVGKMPVHTFFKYCEEPTKAEGFEAVEIVNLVGKFQNDKDKKLFYSYISSSKH